MDVADQLEQIGFRFDDDGLEAVLEQMAAACVAPIEGDGEAGEQAPHQGREGQGSRAEQKMNMIRHQCPREEAGMACHNLRRQARQDVFAVAIVGEDGAPLDAAGDHVMQSSRSIQSWSTWHPAQSRRPAPVDNILRASIPSAEGSEIRPWGPWNQVFPNAACVVTIIDRLIHKAEIINIEGESYRLKEARERTANKTKARKQRKPQPTP